MFFPVAAPLRPRYQSSMARTASPRSTTKPVKDTGTKLVEAATKEFRARGFSGTDSNKIARRAGFAPQTFYRWFPDKVAIFLAVYRLWEEDEKDVLAALHAEGAPVAALVDAVIEHHRAYRLFRRSLRQLSVEDDAVRQARAESRLRQIARFRKWQGDKPLSEAAVATAIFEMERLCDAIAENEFADLGLDDVEPRAKLAELMASLRKPNK